MILGPWKKRKKSEACIRGHKRTPENVYIEPDGSVQCKLCHRLNQRRRRAGGTK